MNLLYLTFGNNLGIHLQATFSIYSFLCHENNIETINIITDNPSYYNHLKKRVNVISITKNELIGWEGKHHFFWRVKIKAIEKICALYPNRPVIYLDADTFLYGNAIELNEKLLTGKAFMHKNEAVLSTGKSSTEKRMWNQIKDKPFAGIKILPTDSMWNAGVVATPNTMQNKECKLAIAICDEMCAAGVTRRLIEQFALTVALDGLYGLNEAKEIIAHYWTTKKLWEQAIGALLMEAYFSNWDFETVLQHVAVFDLTSIPIDQWTKNTNVKLKRMVDRFYPTINKIYLQNISKG